jgi:hypothetical protein
MTKKGTGDRESASRNPNCKLLLEIASLSTERESTAAGQLQMLGAQI